MKIYENIEDERDRIQNCINKFGWTSDHNLDWFVDGTVEDGKPAFVEFEDGAGLLVHQYSGSYEIWSDPVAKKSFSADKISEFAKNILDEKIKKIACNDVSDNIRPELARDGGVSVGETNYSLEWPVLNMEKYDPALTGGYFKDIRNAKSKFYKEHELKAVNKSEFDKKILHKIVDDWENIVGSKDDYNTLKYHNAINNDFRGFLATRVLVVDGNPVGINAGYEVPNNSERFAGIIGVHDYSQKDLGLILWLEDFDWVKKAGYKEMDIQGDEGGGLKFKMQFNPVIEWKTDTFSIMKK